MNAVSSLSEFRHSDLEIKELSGVRQGRLPLVRARHESGVSAEIVLGQRTPTAALSLACHASGLDASEISEELELVPSHFSAMKSLSGGKHFPAAKIKRLCEVLGNTIYVEWIAGQVGCELRPMQSETERENEELKQVVAKQNADLELLMKVFKKGS